MVTALKTTAEIKDVEYICVLTSAPSASALDDGKHYLAVEWRGGQGQELVFRALAAGTGLSDVSIGGAATEVGIVPAKKEV